MDALHEPFYSHRRLLQLRKLMALFLVFSVLSTGCLWLSQSSNRSHLQQLVPEANLLVSTRSISSQTSSATLFSVIRTDAYYGLRITLPTFSTGRYWVTNLLLPRSSSDCNIPAAGKSGSAACSCLSLEFC